MLENFFVGFVVSIVVGIFGVLYHLYGFPLNLLGRKFYCQGDGYDFYKLSGKYMSDGQLHKNNFQDDFNREKIHSYLYRNIRITKTYSKVYIKGHMTAIESDGTLRESDFKGKGKFISDSNNVAYVYVRNSRKVDNETIWWNCMYFLRFTATSTIEGYWFTQDTEKNGRFVMGKFSFKRNERFKKAST